MGRLARIAFECTRPDEWPLATKHPDALIHNEAHFQRWIMAEWKEWWRLGIQQPTVNYGRTPDLMGRVLRSGQKECWLGIELEYAARNFVLHKHDPVNIGLIISYTAWWPTQKIKTLDVISAYRKQDDGYYTWSLDADIQRVFHPKKANA